MLSQLEELVANTREKYVAIRLSPPSHQLSLLFGVGKVVQLTNTAVNKVDGRLNHSVKMLEHQN